MGSPTGHDRGEVGTGELLLTLRGQGWPSGVRSRNVSLRPEGVRSYLFTIARNVITDAWRAERRRPSLVDDGGEVVAVAPAVDDVSQAIEEWVVAEALGRISPAHRAVVQELYYEGRSVREAAVRLALPEGTVKSRAYYAIRALRDAFEEMGSVDDTRAR
ncbi:sigma-70 family RNA polymerase sigma factor, partial [Parafrankia soli]|uniref:sigma-70 family RNA polymerase sigma factor n=1 Tax=Parafrankia soli TaxID=2599596 RepID=UPI000A63847D